ncbi:MAG: hypothetical protein QM776_09455 [Rhodocyclaceae bacterium]
MATAPLPPASVAGATVAWVRSDADTDDYLTGRELHLFTSASDPLTFGGLASTSHFALASPSDLTGNQRSIYFTFAPVAPLPFLATWNSAVPSAGLRFMKTGLTHATANYPAPGLVSGLNMTLGYRACNMIEGAVYVHDFAFAATDTAPLQKLSMDFAVKCDGFGLIKGAIRHNSAVSLVTDDIFVVTGEDRAMLEGRTLLLDGTFSWAPKEKISAYKWTQVSGPAFDMSDCERAVCVTYAPLVAKGGAKAIFQLGVTTASGRSASRQVAVEIRSHLDKQSRFELTGAGYLSGGHGEQSTSTFFNEKTFRPNPRRYWRAIDPGPNDSATGGAFPEAQQSEQFALIMEGVTRERGNIAADLMFSLPKGMPLTPGQYSTVARGTYPEPGLVQFGFNILGRGCNSAYTEVILGKISRAADDFTKISELGFWFDSRCFKPDGTLEPYSNYGLVWLDYQPTGSPTAVVIGPASAVPGETVQLSAKSSSDPGGGIRLFAWSSPGRLHAPGAVDATDPAKLSVTIPADATIGSTYVISLEVLDNDGNTAVTLHKITVK